MCTIDGNPGGNPCDSQSLEVLVEVHTRPTCELQWPSPSSAILSLMIEEKMHQDKFKEERSWEGGNWEKGAFMFEMTQL